MSRRLSLNTGRLQHEINDLVERPVVKPIPLVAPLDLAMQSLSSSRSVDAHDRFNLSAFNRA